MERNFLAGSWMSLFCFSLSGRGSLVDGKQTVEEDDFLFENTHWPTNMQI